MTRRRRRRRVWFRRAFAPAWLILAALAPAAAQQAIGPPTPRPPAGPPEHPGASLRDVAGPSPLGEGRGSSGTDPVIRWRPYIGEAARRFGVPAAWIERVMRAESGGRLTLNRRPLVSRAGAMGLMQLMPVTWGEMRAAHGLGADPFDPKDNILAGAAYLAWLYRRFGYPGLFGAYNAGPARYAAWLSGRGALPEETRTYLARVGADGDSTGLFETANGATTAEAKAPVKPPATMADAADDGHQAPVSAPVHSGRARLFAVDHPVEKATREAAGETAGEAVGPPAGGLFVRLSNGPPRSPED